MLPQLRFTDSFIGNFRITAAVNSALLRWVFVFLITFERLPQRLQPSESAPGGMWVSSLTNDHHDKNLSAFFQLVISAVAGVSIIVLAKRRNGKYLVYSYLPLTNQFYLCQTRRKSFLRHKQILRKLTKSKRSWHISRVNLTNWILTSISYVIRSNCSPTYGGR